jgi:enamine deaminase RidA (YjgF/YER057c/UK114 family)
MSDIEQRLQKAGIDLPEPAAPVASYVPVREHGGLLYVSGQLSMRHGEIIRGTMGAADGPTLDDGIAAARACGVMVLAQLKAALGGLDRIGGCIRLSGFVASTPDFFDQPKIMNGASDLMQIALGDDGRHARAAVGVASLPLGALVEVDGIFALQ